MYIYTVHRTQYTHIITPYRHTYTTVYAINTVYNILIYYTVTLHKLLTVYRLTYETAKGRKTPRAG